MADTEAEPIVEAATDTGCLPMLAAVALAALMLTLGMWTGWASLLAYALVFPVTALVAIPIGSLIYWLARATGVVGWMSAAVGGFVTGVAAFLPGLSSLPPLDEDWTDGIATITNGHYTALGWTEYLLPIAGSGAVGLVAGIFFWFLTSRRSVSRTVHITVWALVVVSVAGASLFPLATMHRLATDTCRAEGASTVAEFALDLPPSEWGEVATQLDHFAREKGWSISKSLRSGPSFPWLQVSMCHAPAIEVSAQGTPDVRGKPRLSIFITSSSGGPGWKPAFREVRDRLQARWPAAIHYTDMFGDPLRQPLDWTIVPPPAARSVP